MKKHLLLTTTVLCCALTPAFAQFGREPSGPKFDTAMAKLFGDNTAFSAGLEFNVKQPSDDTITMPGKITYDTGKARFEMNLSDAKGTKMPPQAAAQMKSMGLDQLVTLTRPDKSVVYLIYPGLNSYVETPLPPAKTGTNDTSKVEVTEIGKDTVDGHPCVKNKVVVTTDQGDKRESTVWNATDLKNFPLKIVHNEQGSEITMLFQNVSLAKPDAATFELPAGYTKYDDMQTMMQTEMMKKMGGGMMGMPPGH
jgi:hypothetical protein